MAAGGGVGTWYARTTGLDALTAAMAMLDGAKIGLIQGDFELSADLTYAIVHGAPLLPDYDGYAASAAVVWLDAYKKADGTVVVTGGDELFQASGVTTTNSITGWYLYQPTGTHLLYVFKFNDPQQIGNDILQGVLVHVEYPSGA